MADNSILPKAESQLVDKAGRPTRAFYSFFNALVSNLQGQINSINKLVKNLALVISALGGDPDSGEGIPDFAAELDSKANKAITIAGMQSIMGGGDLSQNRFIYLDGDVDVVPGVSFYGSPDGITKGWTTFSDNFTPAMDEDDNVTLDLATVADAGGGILQRTSFDAYGRKTGTSAATTTDLTEGSNLYFTNARADARITLQKGVANGLAPLGSDAKINVSYLPAAVLGQVSYQGTWDASAGTPPTTTPEKGWYYIVTVAGSTDLDGITSWNVGDWAIYNGASWDKIDNTDAVVTVNGYTGAVTLTAADVGAATAAQGAKADSAVQPSDLGTAAALDAPASGDAGPTEVVLGNDSRLGGGGGSGDVVGPASAVDGDVALFDGISGKLIKSGGALAAAVRTTALTGLSLATNAVIAATDTVLQAFGKLQAQITNNRIPPGYIDGLKMVWVSGTALTVKSGAAYIQSSAGVLAATSDITKTALSLTASTWYHVYLYSNSGTPDIEIATTAPATAYNGTARSKTGDPSRRYIGNIRTTTGGAIVQFQHDAANNGVSYLGADYALRNLLSNGLATTVTTISAASIVPVTGKAIDILITNVSNQVFISSNSDAGLPLGAGAGSSYYGFANAGTGVGVPKHPVNASQAITYKLLAASTTGGAYIDLNGYTYER